MSNNCCKIPFRSCEYCWRANACECVNRHNNTNNLSLFSSRKLDRNSKSKVWFMFLHIHSVSAVLTRIITCILSWKCNFHIHIFVLSLHLGHTLTRKAAPRSSLQGVWIIVNCRRNAFSAASRGFASAAGLLYQYHPRAPSPLWSEPTRQWTEN